MKIESKIYKGIEYVQLNELPQTQRDKLLQTRSNGAFIKILIDGKIISNCLQYKDYTLWYDTIYNVKPAPGKEAPVTEPIGINVNLALR